MSVHLDRCLQVSRSCVALTCFLLFRRQLCFRLYRYHLPAPEQITAWVDAGLDEHSYITPGLGDFGDR